MLLVFVCFVWFLFVLFVCVCLCWFVFVWALLACAGLEGLFSMFLLLSICFVFALVALSELCLLVLSFLCFACLVFACLCWA